MIQWLGSRENLQETMVFTIKYMVFLYVFPSSNSVKLDLPLIPSGKHTKNDGKPPCLMGKSTISMAMFNSYVKLPEGKHDDLPMINGNFYIVTFNS